MFIGHFGAGFGAKAIARQVSLGWLFAAAQFVDLLWPTLLLAGVERVRIVPGATAVTPLVFEHYPVSHSLLAVLGWALLVGGLLPPAEEGPPRRARAGGAGGEPLAARCHRPPARPAALPGRRDASWE